MHKSSKPLKSSQPMRVKSNHSTITTCIPHSKFSKSTHKQSSKLKSPSSSSFHTSTMKKDNAGDKDNLSPHSQQHCNIVPLLTKSDQQLSLNAKTKLEKTTTAAITALTVNIQMALRLVLEAAAKLDTDSFITLRQSIDLATNAPPALIDVARNTVYGDVDRNPITSIRIPLSPHKNSTYSKAYGKIWLKEINEVFRNDLKRNVEHYKGVLSESEKEVLFMKSQDQINHEINHHEIILPRIIHDDFEPFAVVCGPGVAMRGDSISSTTTTSTTPTTHQSDQDDNITSSHSSISIIKSTLQQIIPKGANVLIYTHGGAYVLGSPSWGPYQNFLHDWCRHLNKNADSTQPSTQWYAISLNYHMAPENQHPTALMDILSGYQDVVESVEPHKVFISGDSAGGNLTLTMGLALRHLYNYQKLENDNPATHNTIDPNVPSSSEPTSQERIFTSSHLPIRQPDGIVAISPITDSSPQTISISLLGVTFNLDDILPAKAFVTMAQAYIGLCRATKVIRDTQQLLHHQQQQQRDYEDEVKKQNGFLSLKSFIDKVTVKSKQFASMLRLLGGNLVEIVPKSPQFQQFEELLEMIKKRTKHDDDDDVGNNNQAPNEDHENNPTQPTLMQLYKPFGGSDTVLPTPSAVLYDQDDTPYWYGQPLVKNKSYNWDRHQVSPDRQQTTNNNKKKRDNNDILKNDSNLKQYQHFNEPDGDLKQHQQQRQQEQHPLLQNQEIPYTHSLQSLTLADTLLNHYSVSPTRAVHTQKRREDGVKTWKIQSANKKELFKKNHNSSPNNEHHAHNYSIFPSSPTLDELPPVLLVVGTREMLFGDALSFLELLPIQHSSSSSSSIISTSNDQNDKNNNNSNNISPPQPLISNLISFFTLNESMSYILPTNISSLSHPQQHHDAKTTLGPILYQAHHRISPFLVPSQTALDRNNTKYNQDGGLLLTDHFKVHWKAYTGFPPSYSGHPQLAKNGGILGINDDIFHETNNDSNSNPLSTSSSSSSTTTPHQYPNYHHPVLYKALGEMDHDDNTALNFDNIAETYLTFLTGTYFTPSNTTPISNTNNINQIKEQWNSTHYSNYNDNWSRFQITPKPLPHTLTSDQCHLEFSTSNYYERLGLPQAIISAGFSSTLSPMLITAKIKDDHVDLNNDNYSSTSSSSLSSKTTTTPHQLYISPGMFHVYPLVTPFPQSQATFKHAVEFMNEVSLSTTNTAKL